MNTKDSKHTGTEGKVVSRFKVWYIPQVPGTEFEVETEDLRTAAVVLETLRNFSLFEFDNRVKPDYSDAGGVAEWYEDEQEWWDIDDYELEERLNG
jgi:hypothetical protein